MKDDPRSLDNDLTLATGEGKRQGTGPGASSFEEDVTIQSQSPRGGKPGRGRSFTVGDLVAGRYRVLRFLAKGGMGEVWEVEDTELGDRVALKTILPEIGEHPAVLERFRRETLLARKVTHPNVCRIFDIGKHEVEGGEAVFFLTMELLQGETLSERLRRGRLDEEEALPLVEQMCAGLDAAHRVGIVHRDFKPANVFLVPDGDDVRVAITDFGLARPGGAADAGVTGTGEIIGTPAYMAPEQLEGGDLGPETDIYALGLVMYEMLTGSRAFEGDTAFQVAVKRLRETPTAPSTHLPDLGARWEGCIMRCLERDPSDRFHRVRDIPGILRGELGLSRRRGRFLRPMLYMLVGCFALLGAWSGYRVLTRGTDRPSEETTPSRRRAAAVLGFQNVSGEPSVDWMSTAISEVLTTELSGGKALRTIPGETVDRCLSDLGMRKLQSLDPETLEVLHSHLGADLVVLGAYTVVPGGDAIRLDVRVQDVHTGEVLASRSETGPVGDFLTLTENAAAELRTALHLAGGAKIEKLASLPDNPEATRLYAEGVRALRNYDYPTARTKLEEAAELSPDSAAVSLALSELWRKLGYLSRSLDAAEKALKLSQELDQEQRLIARARVAALSGHGADAVQAWASLWAFFPDNPDYGLALADAQTSAGQASKALETIAQLRALPEPAASDPRIDLTEATAAMALGQYQHELDAASRAVERARTLNTRQLLAEGLIKKVTALIRLGRLGDAEKESVEAEKIWRSLNNENGVARVLHQRAVLAYRRGKSEEARVLFERALKVYEKLDAKGNMAEVYNGLGGVQLAGGDAAGAEEYFTKALGIYESLGDVAGRTKVLGNLAALAQRRGDFASAIDFLERARVILSDAGARGREAVVSRNIAATYYGRGDLIEARKAFEQAVALDRQTGNQAELAGSLFALGDLLTESAEWQEAGKRFEESRKISAEIEDGAQEARAEFGFLVITCEQYLLDPGKSAPPVEALTGVRKKLEDAGVGDAAALAGVYLARLHEAVGEYDAAADLLEKIAADVQKEPDLGTRVTVAVASARLKALRGDPEGAVSALRKLREQVEGTGILSLGYQVRLALGEALLESKETREEGKRCLRELQTETAPAGWRLLSRKIDRALSRTS